MNVLTIAAYILGAFILYVVYIIYYQYSYWKRRKTLHLELVPVLGNHAPLFLRTASFADHCQNLYRKYPEARYYGYFDFKKPNVIIKDPELIRNVCIKNFDNFVDHDNFVTEEMDPIVGRNLFSLMGQRWKEVRNTVTPSFTAARMKILFELIAECSNDFVEYFVEHPEVSKEFEAKNAFTRYTSDVIATSAFGVKVDSMRDKNNEFYRHCKAATTFPLLGIVKFELLSFFPNLMRSLGVTFLPKATDRFFKALISETVKVRKEKGIIRQDMVHLMMQAMDKEDGIKVTINDIVGQAFFFILAGFDTSSSLMCFIAHELAAHPDIQEKLIQEVDKQNEIDKGTISYESLTRMKYLDMVVSETLRKYPTAPLTNRVCLRDFKFPPPMEGYPELIVEKGTTVLIPIYGLHRDPQYFPDPEKFDPERFSDENKSSINPATYMPFGIGPRQCIGNRFALMEMKVVIMHILRKFVIKFTDKSHEKIVYNKRNFSLDAQDGFWLKFEERKKFN